ncbi:uncharacterized protein LOC122173117 [Chrysemys picta bellii]|uniref:uncharacterized protein LOC122173117 n=1 Tax=Chrysemys picta bellii TaxID=8478 RepID=UPI0032B2EBDC
MAQTHLPFTSWPINSTGHQQSPTDSCDPFAFPGTLPAPTLHLSQTSARPGDSVWLQCSVLSQLLATRIIFCEDGEEVSSQRGLKKKAIYDYDHVVSGVSSGNYTCGYEIKDSENRVTKSQLSPAQRLNLTGDDSTSGSVGGSPPQVVSLPRDQRERVQHDTSNTPEDHIEYASVNWLGSTRHPRPQREDTSTYATIALQRDRCH